MEDWNLRDKIILFIRNWPLLILVFVGSGIISWSIVHLFPPARSAVAEIYIGVDITRVYDVSSLATYAKTEPFNIDDYKNWQLSQVQAIAESEYLAEQVLNELKILDSDWAEISTLDFISMQGLDWYDVGVWRMRIQTQNNLNALQGVEVWREKLISELHRLILESEDVLEFEGQMRSANDAITKFEIRVYELRILRENIDLVLKKMIDRDPELVVDEITRNELRSLFVGIANDDYVWTQVLNDFPEQDQSPLKYINWINTVKKIIDSDTEKSNLIIENLESDLVVLAEVYVREIKEAEGLSVSLYVDEQSSDPRLESYYQDSVIGLIGSFLGLLIYIIIWLMRSEKSEKK